MAKVPQTEYLPKLYIQKNWYVCLLIQNAHCQKFMIGFH